MMTRISLIAVVTLIFASQASASVISASSQTARSKPADSVDYLRVTAIQNDMNAFLLGKTETSAPAALGSKAVPSNAGAFLLTSAPGSASGYDLGGTSIESLFNPDSEKTASAISRDFVPDILATASPGSNGRGNRPGDKGKGRDGDKDKDKGKGRPGTHATPEPSTWLLLGAGLTMVGIYEVIRRRV